MVVSTDSQPKRSPVETCRHIRSLAAVALMGALEAARSRGETSEREFCQLWLAALRVDPTLAAHGWYVPPPHGIAVLFADETSLDRLSFASLRPEDSWPGEQTLDWHKGLAYLYASPFEGSSLVSGDFATTLYFGRKATIRGYMVRCLDASERIAEAVEMGMALRDIYHHAIEVFDTAGLQNNIASVTDPSGTDIGHTVPGVDEPLTRRGPARGNAGAASAEDRIRHHRHFISPDETWKVRQTCAITIEPQLSAAGHAELPRASFHLLVTFEDGRKTVRSNLKSLFGAARMLRWIEPRFG